MDCNDIPLIDFRPASMAFGAGHARKRVPSCRAAMLALGSRSRFWNRSPNMPRSPSAGASGPDNQFTTSRPVLSTSPATTCHRFSPHKGIPCMEPSAVISQPSVVLPSPPGGRFGPPSSPVLRFLPLSTCQHDRPALSIVAGAMKSISAQWCPTAYVDDAGRAPYGEASNGAHQR